MRRVTLSSVVDYLSNVFHPADRRYTKPAHPATNGDKPSTSTPVNSAPAPGKIAGDPFEGSRPAGQPWSFGNALKNGDGHYRLLFESNPLPMWVYDLDTLLFLAVNEAATRDYGYSRREFSGMTINDIQAPKVARPANPKSSNDAARPESSGAGRHLRKDGSIKDVEIASHSLSFAGNRAMLVQVMDVTRRKRAEDAVRRSEARYRSLIQGAAYGICRASVKGRFLDVNPALIRMLGYGSEAELLRLDLTTQLYRDPADRVRLMEKVLSSGEFDRAEVDWIRKDGTLITVRVSGRAVPDEHGRFPFVETIVEDVTERRMLEEQLRQAQKMESIGTLAGGIAHDFNNILTGIMGFSDLAMAGMLSHHPSHANIREVKQLAERAATLTRQLLTFARKQEVKLTPVCLNDTISCLGKFLRRIIGESIDLELSLAKDLRLANADVSQMEQVLMNLCVNARDAMPHGGRLRIKTQNVALHPSYCQLDADVVPGAYVLLSVSDTGTGMDRETQARIFEPFFTTKAQGLGTGLGLSTVYGIVQQHDGWIDVFSEIGRGTSFHTYLPIVDMAAHAAPHPTAEKAARGGETILVVDDESSVRELIAVTLRLQGYTALLACDGDEALSFFVRDAAAIHLVISDLRMPKRGGLELYDHVRKKKPSLKFIFMTGYGEPDTNGRVPTHKEQTVLYKPFSVRDLVRRVREVLDAPGDEDTIAVRSDNY